MSEFRVGDEVRVVGQFVIEAIHDTSFGTQYVHTDADGQSWGFVPGSNTKSMKRVGESIDSDPAALRDWAERIWAAVEYGGDSNRGETIVKELIEEVVGK